MSDNDNIIYLSDHRPVEEPKEVVEPVPVIKQTSVSPKLWNSFSPEAKADAVTNDLVTATMKAFDIMGAAIGKEATDEEIMEIYAVVAKIADRFFDVEKGKSDGK